MGDARTSLTAAQTYNSSTMRGFLTILGLLLLAAGVGFAAFAVWALTSIVDASQSSDSIGLAFQTITTDGATYIVVLPTTLLAVLSSSAGALCLGLSRLINLQSQTLRALARQTRYLASRQPGDAVLPSHR